MHATLEQLRQRNPGKWLLIQLDGPEADKGMVLAAHEDPELIDEEVDRAFRHTSTDQKPLYVTYAVPEGQDLPAFVL